MYNECQFEFSFNSSVICDLEPSVGEFGVYDLVISGTESGDVLCSMTTAKEPVNVYLRECHSVFYGRRKPSVYTDYNFLKERHILCLFYAQIFSFLKLT
jgi:hypothetical protein